MKFWINIEKIKNIFGSKKKIILNPDEFLEKEDKIKNSDNSLDVMDNSKKRIYDIKIIYTCRNLVEKSQGSLVLYDDYWMQGIIRFERSSDEYFIGGIYVPKGECEFHILSKDINFFQYINGKFSIDNNKEVNIEKHVGYSSYKTIEDHLLRDSGVVEIFFCEKQYIDKKCAFAKIAEIEAKGEAWEDHFEHRYAISQREKIGKELIKQYGKII